MAMAVPVHAPEGFRLLFFTTRPGVAERTRKFVLY